MSENKNDNDKRKNENDPFDFFKLSSEPPKGSGYKKPKIPLWVL